MTKSFKILTIVGSPNDEKSNTRALATDFVEEMENAGLHLSHQVISLGTKKVLPCNGCWACTRSNACPINDDLTEIKQAMLDCDMLILASPVYTNQVSAQMKALFDRLFTWYHTFPLLGKYSLSLCTTSNDGYRETGAFIEKILGTYGTHSFGTVYGTGAYTPGFFPRRQMHRDGYRKLAKKAAETILSGQRPPVTRWQKRMFRSMKRKMAGVHAIHFIVNGPVEGQPEPSRLLVWMIRQIIKKKKIPQKDTLRLSRLMVFELTWWRDRGWLGAKSIKQLLDTPIPETFNLHARLLPQPPESNLNKIA